MTITETAEKGDRLETLKALRRKLAETLDETHSGRDIASLTLQMQKVLQQIDDIEDATSGDEIDEIIKADGLRPVRDSRRRPPHPGPAPTADSRTQ